jgi:protein involved in polysaccharide export with SLBB domain
MANNLRRQGRIVRVLLYTAIVCGFVFTASTTFAQGLPSLLPNLAGASGDTQQDGDTQTHSTSLGIQPADSSDQARSSQRSSSDTDATGNAYRTASAFLSANQIIAILHAKPEVMVDIKAMMVDYFQQQGVTVQEDSITDESVYSGIATNADLRRVVSMWLRARGYVTDADFSGGAPGPNAARADFTDESSPAQGSFGDDADPDILRRLASSGRDLPAGSDLLSGNTSAGRTPTATSRPASRGVAAKKPEPATPDAVELLHRPAPYNLQSLRDLYTQVPEQTAKVKRFGSDTFLERGLATKEMTIDMPVGPDYILGPGDGITVSLWGGVTQSFNRTVDREGKVILPEAGPVVVAGLTLERTQALVQGALSKQFRDTRVAVSVAHLRSVRVYVVGEVQRPGAYDISSLATPLSALYSAGGPTAIGSLRTVRHLRGERLIREVDLYEFLLGGVRAEEDRLEPGDTILVPAAGSQIEVSGMVKRPAIYEFKGDITLSKALETAGGLRPGAALTHIRIERIEANGHRATTSIDLAEGSTPESARQRMDAFVVKDGDRVVVAPILPYSEKAIYMAGHVARPGKLPWRDGMKLIDVIHTYQDLLPEPSDHGEIIRLMPPDLRPEAIDFSVSDVLAGNSTLHLQPYDTIRIRGRYESDAPQVFLRGEVLRPGSYALTQGMTAAQLVRMAGGFKRSALLEGADLASYDIKDGERVVTSRRTISIGNAVNGTAPNADAVLKPGDVLSVHQISGWSDVGASVTLQGEVAYPGTYGIQEGEKLSSVIQRAGGFRSTAYPDGAVLVRPEVKELEQKSRDELIRQVEASTTSGRLATNLAGSGEDSATLQLLIQQQNQVLQRLRAQPVIGRLVINVDTNLGGWVNTPADIEMRSGDILTIPKRPGFVLISGQVYNASAITFAPGKTAEWYLRHAGGATDLASRKDVFVIRANGLVIGRRSGEKVLSAKLNPGDAVVVPQKIVGVPVFWKNVLATAQIFTSIAFTAALALR